MLPQPGACHVQLMANKACPVQTSSAAAAAPAAPTQEWVLLAMEAVSRVLLLAVLLM